MKTKSPFLIQENFISPKTCEVFIDKLDIFSPDVDPEGNPIKMLRYREDIEMEIFNRLSLIRKEITDYYNIKYKATETIMTEYFATGVSDTPHCENSEFLRKKWLRTKERDITGIIFLSDYNEGASFDSLYEVYGGKLEFPQHQFGFNPIRGTMIIFPSGPHFINATSPILAGELYQIKFHIAATTPYLYNPSDFPGNYTTWFS